MMEIKIVDEGKGRYGWCDFTNIYINLPRHKSVESVAMTIVHELVHYYLHKSKNLSLTRMEFEARIISEKFLKEELGMDLPRKNSPKYKELMRLEGDYSYYQWLTQYNHFLELIKSNGHGVDWIRTKSNKIW